METEELWVIIANSQNSKSQFNAIISHSNSRAQEMVALTTFLGGMILVGVTDDGDFTGLTSADTRHQNRLVSNATADHVHPTTSPIT